jgi:hypothetical protein
LICHALDKEDIEERAAIHNQIFLTITNSWLGTYEQQYPIMGNAQVMVAKVIWDTAVYWAIPGLLYFHDKIRRLGDSLGVFQNLARFMVLSEHIQAFFRDWFAIEPSKATDVFIKYYDFDFSAQLQIGMTAELDDAELEAQMAENVSFLERLGGQLASTVIETFAQYQENEAIQRQVQRWKADQYLAELITLYQQMAEEHPINASWITLGRSKREPQEVVG